MATQNISGKIQFRRDTAANWTSKNPTLLAGELGYETDTHKGKVGDGSTAWKNLPYVWKTTVATGSTNGTIAVDGTDVAVKGLGSAAYTASSAYAAASHNHDGRYVYWGGNSASGSAWGWGTLTAANGYTQLSYFTSSDGGAGGFANKSGQISMQLDGFFYQKEGLYRCLDTSDSSSFAPASHSHSYLPLSGGTASGTITASIGSSGVCFRSMLQGYSRGTAPSSALYQTALLMTDQNEKRTGIIENTFVADGSSWLCLRIYNNKGDTDGSGALVIGQRSDGNYYSTAPNPTTTSNTNEIATTSWVNTKVASYLPLSGGTITGDLTFKGTANNIFFQGTKANYSMIRFIDNSSDGYGNGISIGGGGAVILGGGEAATTMQDTIIGTGGGKGGTEILALCGDGNVDVYSNCQNGAGSAKKFSFNTGGVFQVPTGGSITVGGTAVSLNGHTHNYAGSSSAGGAATSAAKLNTDAGSATQPVYFSNGVPVATTYALNATVPSGAKFTDTTYTGANGISLSGTTFSNSGVRSVATGSANGTISVNTNGTAANVAVKGLGSAAYTASTAYAAASHNQASNTINAMTGYSKPSTTSAITASDTLNTAIGKLEKALEPDVSLSINDPGGSAVWIEVPVEHLIVGSTTPTDHNAIWIEIIS